MPTEWEIKGRAKQCTATQRPFEEGEFFYTLLFDEKAGFRREDLCEEAWQQRQSEEKNNESEKKSGKKDKKVAQPFSFWRSKFELPPPPPPETLKKQTAEDLLRRYMEDGDSAHANARYILALMLERKRILKQIEAKKSGGIRTLIYEHTKTGDVFVIPEPSLQLDQIEAVQNEVAALLA